jgi:1-acyl-sn-glycerol-3-phosphate acyltransferase
LRLTALFLLFVVCAPLHILSKLLFRRSPWPPWFLSASAWIIGARVRRTGAPIRRHTLLVCNHTSWLDILILGGATKCTFVSKAELGHPFIRWLADQNRCVYVERAARADARDQAIAIARALERDKPVALFPEGTTGPGTHLLPFRSTLLEAAKFAARDVEIRGVAIDYGAAAAEIGWYHESGKDNVLRILGRSGTLPVAVHVLPPMNRAADRKQLAHDARERIAQTLGFKSEPHSLIGVEK